MRPSIVSIVNHKGGCLKTTVTADLGAALALAGRRVLLIDLDAQQNLTQSLIGPVEYEEGKRTLYDALVDETGLDHLITPTPTKGLDIVPCTEDFAGADISLVSAVGREAILKECFHKTDRLRGYDVVLLDNPPSISLVVMNSLVASDYFFVPCSAEYLPMVGLTLLGNSIGKMQKVAPNLKPLGVVLTMYSRNERICRQVERRSCSVRVVFIRGSPAVDGSGLDEVCPAKHPSHLPRQASNPTRPPSNTGAHASENPVWHDATVLRMDAVGVPGLPRSLALHWWGCRPCARTSARPTSRVHPSTVRCAQGTSPGHSGGRLIRAVSSFT